MKPSSYWQARVLVAGAFPQRRLSVASLRIRPGQPVEGATVRIVYPDDEAMSGIGTIMGNVKTNTLGRFHLPYVKAIGRFMLEVTKPGYLPAFSQILVGAGAGKPIENVVVPIDLKRGATLEGTVVGPNGRPIPGAGVSLWRPGPLEPRELVHLSRAIQDSQNIITEASEEGRFRFTGLPAGQIILTASSPGGEFKPDKLELIIGSTEDNRKVVIVLARK